MATFTYIDEKYIKQLSSYVDRFKDVGNNTYNCRCPYCGDSQKSLLKARGYFYVSTNGRWRYKCHNCAINVSLSNIINYLSPALYEEYRFEYFTENNANDKVFVKKDKTQAESFENLRQVNAMELILNSRIMKELTPLSQLNEENPGYKYIVDRKIPKDRMEKLYYVDNLKNVVRHIKTYNIDSVPAIAGVIIPYFDKSGILQCFQVRNIDSSSKMRYLTYDIVEDYDHIFNYENLNSVDPAYVFEGAFDSMFCHNACAASGASIMQKLAKIKEINKNVVIVFDNDYKTNKDINKLLNDVIDQGYSVVLYDVEMDGYKDINQYARDKNKTVEDITAYLQKCTYSDLNAKMFLASQKRKRGSIQWANESTASTQKTNHQKSNAKSRQLGQRKNSVFKI